MQVYEKVINLRNDGKNKYVYKIIIETWKVSIEIEVAIAQIEIRLTHHYGLYF